MNLLRHSLLSAIAGAAAAQAAPQSEPPREALQRTLLDRAFAEEQRAIAEATDLFEDHTTWERAWRFESPRYEVRTTHSFGLAKDLAEGLEEMQAHFRRILARDYEPPARLPVFVFDDIAAYNRFGADVNADEHSSFYGSFWAAQHPDSPVAAAFDANLTWLRIQVTHSATHQWLRRAWAASPPIWLDEGLAAYFALYWSPAWGSNELRRIVREDRFVPLPQLFADPLAAWATRPHERLIEVGMLFHYLMHHREDTRLVEEDGRFVRAPFRDYIVALLEGRDASGLPAHAVIADLEALENALKAFAIGG